MKKILLRPYLEILKTLFLCGLIFSSFIGTGQDMSPEMMAVFMKDQDKYFEQLDLSGNQKRYYEEITRKYDKRLQSVDLAIDVSPSRKKTIRREIQKSRNAEMKKILSSYQYKTYLRRQKEIKTKYNVN